MNDVRLIWDGARADFGLLLGSILGSQAAVFSGSGQVSTPASATVNGILLAGEFDLRARVALNDWTPASAVSVIDQCDNAGLSTFFFNVKPGGYLAVGLSEDGGLPSDITSTAPVSATDGAAIWIRASVDTAGDIRFYTSQGGVAWTDLGAPVPAPNGIGLGANVPMLIGKGRDLGGQLAGKVYRAEIRDGLDGGTIIAVFDAAAAPAGSAAVNASTGETWTLSGAVALASTVLATPAYDLEAEEGLETAVLLSLFTDRRADEGEELPDLGSDRRGWWGDALPVVDGDLFGSKLWLLRRSTLTPAILARAEQYARESLAWLVEDGVVSVVEVTASAPRPGWGALEVVLQRPDATPITYKYDAAWAAQAGR